MEKNIAKLEDGYLDLRKCALLEAKIETDVAVAVEDQELADDSAGAVVDGIG